MELSRDDYMRRVRRIIEYIHAGDVFQVNFTQRFLAPRPAGLRPFDLYRRLRAINPAPFGAFLQLGESLTVASASPERFLALDRHGRIEARPIKGTRRRSPVPEEDAAIAAELAASGKDRAENLMITDLLRNDIGRVARGGSVRVPALLAVESYATVHHLVSVIEGQLRDGLGPIDLLRATFPGGSITGAPKVRAMEIIDELEPAARGPYCGAIGWIGFDGAMDTSIVIRALTLTPEKVIAQAGGGIVADSDPAAEYAEMMAKVSPALTALGMKEDAWLSG
jgi:para-aminobenzoate synthetase component I